MINRIFLLSGTPGTGKTSIAKAITEKYQIPHLSLTEIVLANQLFSEEDIERQSKIVDEEKLIHFIDQYIASHEGDLIIEGHYADLVESSKIAVAIVLRCHPKVLYTRLKARNYLEKKVKENVQAELVGDCNSYMLELEDLHAKHCIFELDTAKMTLLEAADRCYEIYQHPERHAVDLIGHISWISDQTVNPEDFL